LQGRRILVTGGATGIGAAAVHVLTEAGAAVVATYHRTPPPDPTGVSWMHCDVRDSAAVDDMVKGAAETLGGLDVLAAHSEIRSTTSGRPWCSCAGRVLASSPAS
jgi:NAD(P)-dependent dehydrogenase (short-subunit alcohol dehydrogenase family)